MNFWRRVGIGVGERGGAKFSGQNQRIVRNNGARRRRGRIFNTALFFHSAVIWVLLLGFLWVFFWMKLGCFADFCCGWKAVCREAGGMFPRNRSPAQSFEAVISRCRRWRSGDLRMGLREAWCAVRLLQNFGNDSEGRFPQGLAPDSRAVGGGSKGGDAIGGETWERPDTTLDSGVALETDSDQSLFPAPVGGAVGQRAAPSARPIPLVGATLRLSVDSDQGGAQRHPVGNENRVWSIASPILLTLRLSPNFQQVKRYLEDALGERPVSEFCGRLLFERRERFRWGVSWRRCLLDAPAGGVRLQWIANDDFGVSELREFFEAPFFSEAETERFYRWLSRRGWHEGPFRRGSVWMGVFTGRDSVFVEIFWRENPTGREE